MIKIEYLYPEVANLYGDAFNPQVLQRSYPDRIEIIETHLNDAPSFADGKIDLIYMGALPEKYQEMAIELLSPYKEAFSEYIDSAKPALFTGNSFEIMGECIETDDGAAIPALGIFEGYAKRDMIHRYNSMYHGIFSDKENNVEFDIVGFKSQFTKLHGTPQENRLFTTVKEVDMVNGAENEGVRVKNFMGTYLNGPLLIMNPSLSKYILGLMGIEDPKLIYEDIMTTAYKKRLEDVLNPNTSFEV